VIDVQPVDTESRLIRCFLGIDKLLLEKGYADEEAAQDDLLSNDAIAAE
jgi:hypothetical protein